MNDQSSLPPSSSNEGNALESGLNQLSGTELPSGKPLTPLPRVVPGSPEPVSPDRPGFYNQHSRLGLDSHVDGFSTRSTRTRSRHQGKDRHNRFDSRKQTEKLFVFGSCALGAVAIFFVGFFIGQKKEHASEVSHQIIQRDAEAPSSASGDLLDHAFRSLDGGNYRQAMSDFRKVQENQPALTGIDCLTAESAYKAGEYDLALDAATQAISKNESADQARVLLALINLNKSKGKEHEESQLADPFTAAENEIRNYSAGHPADAWIHGIWGDLMRSDGSYRSAVDILHQGVLRTDPSASREVLSTKEQLARLQNEPAKTPPSLSELTSMTGEQCFVAALASLQQHKSEAAVAFLEKAREFYSPQSFRELIRDVAFDDFRIDSVMKPFFKQENSTPSQ